MFDSSPLCVFKRILRGCIVAWAAFEKEQCEMVTGARGGVKGV